jgi:hypothetical protein
MVLLSFQKKGRGQKSRFAATGFGRSSRKDRMRRIERPPPSPTLGHIIYSAENAPSLELETISRLETRALHNYFAFPCSSGQIAGTKNFNIQESASVKYGKLCEKQQNYIDWERWVVYYSPQSSLFCLPKQQNEPSRDDLQLRFPSARNRAAMVGHPASFRVLNRSETKN